MRLLDDPEAHGVSAVERRAAWTVRAQMAAQKAAAGTPMPSTLTTAPASPNEPSRLTTDRARETTIRVRTERVDTLVEMVGELVIAHSMIAQDPAVVTGTNVELARKVAHAGKIIRDLQDLSMGMRMVPLRAQFQKLARLVRDLATKAGKEVYFEVEGEETEIDRNLVDSLSDPLVHMIRNAVDHGIESPSAREACGKPRIGIVRLRASHASGNVMVDLSDDGRGLSRDRIAKKAIELGIISTADGLSDTEVFALIFSPGFSTADQVTEISGRGVGMDVVRRNLEALRGRVDIASEPGAGTTFTLRLPLTLAITDGMLVRVGAERFVVPTSHIRLSFRPEASALTTYAGRGEMVVLRDEVIPLVRLHQVFDVTGAESDPTRALVMVVGDGAGYAALLVDELLGQQQVVAKTLGDGLGNVPGVSGGAILGDGRVGLILDLAEVLALARGFRAAARTGVTESRAVA
jgi:two-component system chemotaxis sensor kinase CheA